jgi:hypothetical protein
MEARNLVSSNLAPPTVEVNSSAAPAEDWKSRGLPFDPAVAGKWSLFELVLLLAMIRWAGTKGYHWWGTRRMADELRVNENTVTKALSKMRKAGLIERHKGEGSTYNTILHRPAIDALLDRLPPHVRRIRPSRYRQNRRTTHYVLSDLGENDGGLLGISPNARPAPLGRVA